MVVLNYHAAGTHHLYIQTYCHTLGAVLQLCSSYVPTDYTSFTLSWHI